MESRERYTHTLSYVAICLSMLCGGTTSLFATYGSSFSEVLGFSQYETNLVASLGDYAHYMSAPLFGYLSTRTGPTLVIQIAAILMFLGYMGLSYALDNLGNTTHRVGTMSVLFALVGVGSKAAYMSSMATAARNFKHSRHSGIALGIPLSLYGLSTFVFSSVKAKWFETDETPVRYLAFMAVVSGVAHLAASRFVVLKGDPLAPAAAVQVARKRTGEVDVPLSPNIGVASAAAVTDTDTGSPVVDSIEMKETRRRRMTVSATDPRNDTTSDTDAPLSTTSAAPSSTTTSPVTVAQKQQSPIHGFIRDPTAWCLLIGLICFSGPGLAFVNNCGTMVRAMAHGTTLSDEQVGRYKDRVVATQSFFSFSSRLAVGYLSDIWRTRLRLPRAGMLVLAAMLMIYAQNAAATVARLEDLHRLAILVGVAMGSVFTLAPTITAETWGADNFGVCWGVITLGPAIGGHMCNLIFGSNWDQGLVRIAARLGPNAPQESVRCDNECFVPAFLVTTKIAYIGLFFFIVVMSLPRFTALWNRNA
ncbi:hypothetical protein FB645_002003 [Coemansia sp. IMI 203386]|nr:hypothetical protein FB645_002003 [Coemansia sp. IMI 203386]